MGRLQVQIRRFPPPCLARNGALHKPPPKLPATNAVRGTAVARARLWPVRVRAACDPVPLPWSFSPHTLHTHCPAQESSPSQDRLDPIGFLRAHSSRWGFPHTDPRPAFRTFREFHLVRTEGNVSRKDTPEPVRTDSLTAPREPGIRIAGFASLPRPGSGSWNSIAKKSTGLIENLGHRHARLRAPSLRTSRCLTGLAKTRRLRHVTHPTPFSFMSVGISTHATPAAARRRAGRRPR